MEDKRGEEGYDDLKAIRKALGERRGHAMRLVMLSRSHSLVCQIYTTKIN